MVKDNYGRVIRKEELKNVVNSMSTLNVTEGYMEFANGNNDGKLLFFEKDPKFGGAPSIKVTMGQLISWVIQYKE